MISISVVSHNQIRIVEDLLVDLSNYCKDSAIEVILTLNQPDEELSFSLNYFPFPINVIRNSTPQGFAANQNQAFRAARGSFFCVINPDIRLNDNPFPFLLDCLQDSGVGMVTPTVINEVGGIEDCARYFPTPLIILRKLFGGCKGSDYLFDNKFIYPDWVPGMFMVFPVQIYKKLNGFDERFFLYYEDVDLCARLRILGYKVVLCSEARVIHHAHRASHKNFTYFKWHLASMMRYFFSAVFIKVFYQKFEKKFCRKLVSLPH